MTDTIIRIIYTAAILSCVIVLAIVLAEIRSCRRMGKRKDERTANA